MFSRRLKNPIFLIYLLVIYVTLQFSWWLYLIFSLYDKIYSDKDTLSKKTWMLLGEGSVFFLILIIGVIIILRAFKREQALTLQQENFVLSVTHELKTPIASVKLFLQTLQKRELPEDKKIEIYNRCLTDINRLDGLVNNILITRSIENENYFLNKSEVDLKEFIEKRILLLQDSMLKSHQIELELAEATLAVDPVGFESILVNLLENATKYSTKDSIIGIQLSNKPDGVTLQIKDEGVGISKEKRMTVFSKFYREENEMTRKSKGTGLGLYIVKFLVEQHNGRIELKANEPKGLIVNIEFKK
ncbi:MAG: two-component system phosphate regulon sensor histidine kinase PhoR [Crocinitomix sp.]|jgi:two-component system phosphate regulon sensor histidine kinase PhoR